MVEVEEWATAMADEIVVVPMPPPLLVLAARRNEVAILWRVQWCARDEMVNTLLQYSHPPLSPSHFRSLALFLSRSLAQSAMKTLHLP